MIALRDGGWINPAHIRGFRFAPYGRVFVNWSNGQIQEFQDRTLIKGLCAHFFIEVPEE